MNYISVCSGIEAATVAWETLGWKAIAYSDIDPFCQALLSHYYPKVPLYGDFTQIDAKEFNNQSVDLLVGGTPCQSFSVAGLRGGLDDDRGNLSLEFFKLAQRTKPKWIIWENVPGVLTSNGGRDFQSIISAMDELGYGYAWRILNAQYFGVPQRRRRIFLIGYLGDWRPPTAVLFDKEGLRGNLGKSKESKPNHFGPNIKDFTENIRELSFDGYNYNLNGIVCGTLSTNSSHNRNLICSSDNTIRRLTPVECERLQGFPDNYTAIPYKNQVASNVHRYKALGNSMAVPVMRWIGERINKVEEMIKNV